MTGNKHMWTDRDIMKATGASYEGPSFQSSRFSIDTRTLQPGDIFIALQGEQAHGGKYVREALDKEAAAVITCQLAEKAKADAPIFIVPDSLVALHQLAHYQRARLTKTTLIGVTGSAGKTTTKEMLRLVLSAFGKVYANIKSYNNHWGMPLTLANCTLDADFAVFELGMNHAGEILALTKILRPQIALVINVGGAHTAFFPSIEAIAKAKGEIFAGLPEDGTAIINGDLPTSSILRQEAAHIKKVFTFGANDDNTFQLLQASVDPPFNKIEARFENETIHYQLGTPGRHCALNSVAALSVVASLGLPVRDAVPLLQKFEGVEERGLIRKIPYQKGHITILDESYNANPLSVSASLERFHEMGHPGRKIAILGEMRELGHQAQALHLALIPSIINAKIDRFYGCEPLTRPLLEALPKEMQGAYAPTVEELIPTVLGDIKAGDAVLIKGSLSTRMRKMVQALTQLEGDKEVLLAAKEMSRVI